MLCYAMLPLDGDAGSAGWGRILHSEPAHAARGDRCFSSTISPIKLGLSTPNNLHRYLPTVLLLKRHGMKIVPFSI